MMGVELPIKGLVAAVVLAALLVLETLVPFFADQLASLRARLRHDARNFVWGLVSALLGAVFVSGLLVAVVDTAAAYQFGVLRWLAAPWPVDWVLAILLFDLWMYLWHRLNHEVPFLWRFHRMHHSERQMDASTGVRFHPGEIVLSGAARLAVVPLLGMSVPQVVAYESILLPIVLFHHSNVRLPRWLDFGLARLIVSPAVHRVHHSHLRPETNSNYGSIFPWWDRALGTLRMRQDVDQIEYGLDEFRGPASDTLWGMLRTPLANPRASSSSDRDAAHADVR